MAMAPTVERVKKWLVRKWFLLGMITTLNMPGWEPEERICLGIFLYQSCLTPAYIICHLGYTVGTEYDV